MKKILKRLWNLVQSKPEVSALIVSAIITIPMTILFIISIPDKSLFNVVSASFMMLTCVGGLFWFCFVMVFGEKLQRELSQKALKSELEVMINQSLIENGSIKTEEDFVKL
jgi:hypothetical protein